MSYKPANIGGTVKFVIPHQMKSEIGTLPLINSVDFPLMPNDTVNVPRYENVHIGIEHHQKAEHSSVESS